MNIKNIIHKFTLSKKVDKQPPSYWYNQYMFYLSRYYWNYADDRTLDDLKYLSASKYNWKKSKNKLWLVYLAMLIENDKNENDIENIAKKYLYFHGLKEVDIFISVSYWFHKHNFTNPQIEKSAKIYEKILKTKEDNVFYNLIKDKKVAVVGNGPCELDKNKGEEIDLHDIVIRFNEFHTKGYEKDYGTKCDVWANYFSNNNFLKYNERPDCKLYLWTNDSFFFNKPVYAENAYSCIDKTWDVISNMRRYAWDELGFCYDPTSGFVVIMQIYKLLGNFDNVDFYGFKFLENENTETKHYFQTEFKNDYDGHNFADEAEFLRDFILKHKNQAEKIYH